MDIRIKVNMVPHGKAVEIVVRKNRDGKSHGALKKTNATEKWERDFAFQIAHQMPSYQLDFPVRVDILAVFPRPQYLCKIFKKTGLPKFPAGLAPHPQKPDRDNIVKSVQDSLKVHWTDDKLVTWGETIKAYVELDLSRIVDDHAAQRKARVVLRIRSVAETDEAKAAISLGVFQASCYGIEGRL